MLWQVRAVVKDRPGAVAALAASFGAAGVNILALEILPTGGGCVVDELVLTPLTAGRRPTSKALRREPVSSASSCAGRAAGSWRTSRSAGCARPSCS